MDKTVNTHASNGILAKQSLPLPRTLFSEGGSVVFSELLAESTFRPERFAFDLGKKADPLPRAAQSVEPAQNPQDCRDCQEDFQQESLQKESLRRLNDQRAQDSAVREAQERSQGAQQASSEQASFDARHDVARHDAERQQEASYRADQIDRIASQQQNALDKAQEARLEARQAARQAARSSQARETQASYQESRGDDETASPRVERAQSASDDHRASQAQNQNTQAQSTQDPLATQHQAQDEANNDKDADKAGDKAADKIALETRSSSSETKITQAKTVASSEEIPLATTAEDSLEQTLAGLVDDEGIDVFALQDKGAKTAQNAGQNPALNAGQNLGQNLAAALLHSSATLKGELVSSVAGTQQTGTADAFVSRTIVGLEDGTTPNPTTPVAAEQSKQEGEAGQEGEGKAQQTPTGHSTDQANIDKANIEQALRASVATAFSLPSDKVASSTEGLAASLRDNAARLLQQANQIGVRVSSDAGLVSQISSETTASDKDSTKDSTTTLATSGLSSSARATSNENSQLSTLAHDTRQAAAERAAGSAALTATLPKTATTTSAATSTATSTLHPAQTNAQANTQTNTQANAQSNTQANTPPNSLAQALSSTGAEQRLAQENIGQQKTALPEGIEVRVTQEVRAHRPEGLRLSGATAFDTLRLAGSAAQTTGYAKATTGAATGAATGNAATSAANPAAGVSSAAGSHAGEAAQTGLASSLASPSGAAAKLAARLAERQEAVRERRDASSTTTKSKTGGPQALLQSLAARLTGARADAAQGGARGASDRAAQTLGEARLGQAFGQGSNSQGSNSQGSNAESSFNNGFSQSLQGYSASSSARASGAAPAFTTASSFVREQVFVNIQRAVEGKVESLTIKLRPELLGRIEIRLDGDAAGRLQIVVLAERGETLELLQRDARQLEQALQEAGIRTQDQGLQFGLKGQGNAQTEGEAQRQEGGEALSSDTKSDAETDASESASDGQTLASVVDRLQVRQDGRLNVEI